uniref:Uncharacterized protein n=1 Tax=Zeugodacus cucurbitae TaxID=28588 RepID=A0A0A1XRL8_ZEUCU
MTSAKARGAKPKSSLKRDDGRNKRKGKEVRELWFNPHAKKRGETLEEIYGCDCDCDVMLDENVQRELRRLSRVYSQTTVGEEDDDDEEGKSKGFLCFKKSSQRSKSKQKEDKEKTKRRKSKDKEDREKAKRGKSKENEDREKAKRRKSNERESPRREHERKSRSRPPSSVNGRFKTQEEVRHYRELKRIYTTKPRPRQSRAKPTGTICFKKKKDKRREEDAGNSLESSSDDSVYSITQDKRKSQAESALKSRARSNKRDASSRQRRSLQRKDDKKQKEKEEKKNKKSNVGCCGKRKKSKADEEEEEFEAYKLAQSAPKKSKKPTVPPECALTPDEIELLEKLKQTYAMEEPKVVRKAPPPSPPEETGCCGSKSKKKKRRPEDESYTPRKTKSAEINVKLKKPPKSGKSKSDSSFYTSGRKETHNKTKKKHKNCFCFDCIRRKCQSGKPTKKHAKKPKEKIKIQYVKHPKEPVIKPHHTPEKPKKSDDRKPKPTKTISQEEDSNLSCCTFQKNKTKQAKQKEAIPKSKSPERVRKKTSVLSCCSFTKREKSKKPDDAQQKPPTPKDHEKLPKKTSNVSCCSFSKSDKSKKEADTQQKPPKVRNKEKPQKKESNVSCCSITKKEKPKKLDETAQKPPKEKERVQKEPRNVICCPLTTKDKRKQSDGSQQKAPKKEGRNLFNMWCCTSDKKDKTKKDLDTKNVKSQEKISTKPTNTTCCSFSKKVESKKLSESAEKPRGTKQKIKVKEKLTAASCCPVFKKDKHKKSDDTPQKVPKKKASEITCCSIHKKDKQMKTKDSQQMSPRTKVKVKIKKKTSDTSCCPIFDKDKPNKVDVPKRKPTKVKSTENLQRETSYISVFSCCSVDKNKPKTVDRTKKKSVKPKRRERTQNPFEIFCAFCKKRRSGKPKLMKPLTPIKSTSPPRQDSIKPQGSKPRTKTKSVMSFQTCWDWCDDDGDDNVPIRRQTVKRETSAEKLEQTAPKSKSSCTSFWTCCSSMCVPKKSKPERKSKRNDKTESRKQAVDEGTVITKPENISYCKALYQEFENLAKQQKLCPILLPDTNLDKKSNKYGLSYCQQNLSQQSVKASRSSSRTKSRKQQRYQKKNIKSKAKEDKEIRKKLEQQKVASVTYIKLPKRNVKTDMQNENSNSDSGIENAYVPQYVLGKPVQLGVSQAHARNMTYNLILNSDTRRQSDKYFNKGFIYGIGCQN